MLQGGLCEKREGAALCQTQPVPAPQWFHRTTQLSRHQSLWPLCENIFQKGQKTPGRERRKEQKERERAEGRCIPLGQVTE